MYIPLESYLATMLRPDVPAADLQRQAETRLHDWSGIEGASPLKLSELSRSQLVVLSWITSMNQILAARDLYAERTLLLDFEQFLRDPDTEPQGSGYRTGRRGEIFWH
jgi:hypothetical protein